MFEKKNRNSRPIRIDNEDVLQGLLDEQRRHQTEWPTPGSAKMPPDRDSYARRCDPKQATSRDPKEATVDGKSDEGSQKLKKPRSTTIGDYVSEHFVATVYKSISSSSKSNSRSAQYKK